MVLRPMCMMVGMGMMAVQVAFTAGAVAGTAGMVGLYALRRAMRNRAAS
jgi:hypothetical protein